MHDEPAAALRRHALLAWASLAFVALDLVVFRMAAIGRDAFVAVVGRCGLVPFVIGVLGALTIASHAVTALMRFRSVPEDFAYGDRDRRHLQWMTALAIAPLVVTRLAYGPASGWVLGLDGFGVHQRMLDDLGSPLWLSAQCLGVTSLALHAAQGLAVKAKRSARPARVSAAYLAAAIYVVFYVDALARFAVGRTFLPIG